MSYENVCMSLLEYLWDEYKVGFHNDKARKFIVIEFLTHYNGKGD